MMRTFSRPRGISVFVGGRFEEYTSDEILFDLIANHDDPHWGIA
jgi:hypothetical protein